MAALDHLIAFLRSQLAGVRLVGIGHRVVHGGLEFAAPVRIDADVTTSLEKLIPLAPLHQPHNLAPVRRLLERAPSYRRSPVLIRRFTAPIPS